MEKEKSLSDYEKEKENPSYFAVLPEHIHLIKLKEKATNEK